MSTTVTVAALRLAAARIGCGCVVDADGVTIETPDGKRLDDGHSPRYMVLSGEPAAWARTRAMDAIRNGLESCDDPDCQECHA